MKTKTHNIYISLFFLSLVPCGAILAMIYYPDNWLALMAFILTPAFLANAYLTD